MASVRFTPAALAGEEAPAVARGPKPPELSPAGVRVQLRRRVGGDVLRRAAFGGVPPEIEALAAAAAELPIALRLAGEPLRAPARARPLVRALFDVPGARAAWLDVTEACAAAPSIDVCEHGVRLARYGFRAPAGFPEGPHGGLALPVRVVVDAPELPTNASRSALREDSALLRGIVEGAAAAFGAGVRALAARLAGASVPADVEILDADPIALEDALGAIACVIAGGARRGEALSDEAQAVLALPLLRDGAGRPLAASRLAAARRAPLYVWRGPEPLAPELAPWMGDVVWARGRAIERLLEGLELADAEGLIERARVGLARRDALHAHPAKPPILPATGEHLAREAFRVTEGRFAGLEGEVAVVGAGVGARGAVVRLFVEGRHLGTLPLEPRACPLPLDVALAWEGRLRPRFDYDGVEDEPALRIALRYAIYVGTRAASRLAATLGVADELAAARLRPVLRAAVAAAYLPPSALGLDAALGTPGLAEDDPLRDARIWRTTERGRFESVASLAADARASRSLLVAGPSATGCAVSGRPVVAADAVELASLLAALGEPLTVVAYDRALVAPEARGAREAKRVLALREAVARARALSVPATPKDALPDEARPAMLFGRPGARGLVAVDVEPHLLHLHAGVALGESPWASWLGPVAMAVDDDSTVPTPAWSGVAWSGGAWPLADIEEELALAIVGALEGDAEARRRVEGVPALPAHVEPVLRAYLLRSARALRDELDAATAAVTGRADRGSAPRQALLERIEALPVLVALDAAGAPAATSMAEVAARHGAGELPIVAERPGFETLDWWPLVAATRVEADALACFAGGRARPATEANLAARRAKGDRARALRALRAQPALDPRALGDAARPGSPVVVVETPEGDTAAVALPRAPLGDGRARVEVLSEARAVPGGSLDVAGPPLVARVDLHAPEALSADGSVGPAGRARAAELVRRAADDLALALVARAEGPGQSSRLFGELDALRLVAALLEGKGALLESENAAPASDPDAPLDTATLLATLELLGTASGGAASAPSLADRLRGLALRWPTVQGDERPFGELTTADGKLWFGRERHVPWRAAARAPAQLDAPVLYLPATPTGEAAHAMLAALGVALRDVSPGLRELAARRATSRPTEAPRLPGAPPHPALRASLAALGITSCEGELEIALGPASDVTLIDLGGAARALNAALPMPLRAIARVDAVGDRATDTAICKDLARAGVRLLRAIGASRDEVPAFARDHLRAIVCRTIGRRGKVPQVDRRARVFPDTRGGWHAIDELARAVGEGGLGAWPFTPEPPPHPARSYDPPVLRLDGDEAKRLGQLVALRDATASVRRDLAGERRAAAPPLASLDLGPAKRAACLRTVALAEGPVQGEIGLLAPGEANRRGLTIHVGRRPLCLKGDAPGWPLVGTLEATALEPNRHFDGPKHARELDALRAAVRAAADAELRAWLAAPADALAARFVDRSLPGAPGAATLVVGALWLPREWPRAPRVRVMAPGLGPLGAELPLAAPATSPHLDAVVPALGHLLVLPPQGAPAGEGWREAVAALALAEAEAMLEEAAARPDASPGALDAYRWDLRLLGRTGGTLAAASALAATDGRALGPEDVLAELAARGELWTSDGRGTADGAQPSGTPSFFLREGEGAPLRVLGARVRGGALRALGGLAGPEGERGAGGADERAEAEPEPPASAGPRVASVTTSSWLAGLVQSAIAVFAPEIPPETKAARGLRATLRAELARLALSGDPVVAVDWTASGRPVRYDPERRVVLLNRRHPAIAARSDGPAARAIPALVAAAVTEINRALVAVTDAEELRALAELMGAREGA
jgi:hypothetical protein